MPRNSKEVTNYSNLSEEQKKALTRTGIVLEGSDASIDFMVDSYLLAETDMAVGQIRELTDEQRQEYAGKMFDAVKDRIVTGEVKGGAKTVKANLEWLGAFFKRAINKVKNSNINFPTKEDYDSLDSIKNMESGDFMYAAEYSRKFALYTDTVTGHSGIQRSSDTNKYGIDMGMSFIRGFGGKNPNKEDYRNDISKTNETIFSNDMNFITTLRSFATANRVILDAKKTKKERALIKAVTEIHLLDNFDGVYIGKLDLAKNLGRGEENLAWLGVAGYSDRFKYNADNIYFGEQDLTEEEADKLLQSNIEIDFDTDRKRVAILDGLKGEKSRKQMCSCHRKLRNSTAEHILEDILERSDHTDVFNIKNPNYDSRDPREFLIAKGRETNRVKLGKLGDKTLELYANKFDEIFAPIEAYENSLVEVMKSEESSDSSGFNMLNRGCFQYEIEKNIIATAYKTTNDSSNDTMKTARKSADATKAFVLTRIGENQNSKIMFCPTVYSEQFNLVHDGKGVVIKPLRTAEEALKTKAEDEKAAAEYEKQKMAEILSLENESAEKGTIISDDVKKGIEREKARLEGAEREKRRLAEKEAKEAQEKELQRIENQKKAEEKKALKQKKEEEEWEAKRKALFDNKDNLLLKPLDIPDYSSLSDDQYAVLRRTGLVYKDKKDAALVIDFLVDTYLLSQKAFTVQKIKTLTREEKQQFAAEMTETFKNHPVTGEIDGGEKKAKENLEWYGAFFKQALSGLMKSDISFPEGKDYANLKSIHALGETDFGYASEYARRLRIYTRPLNCGAGVNFSTENNKYGIDRSLSFQNGFGGAAAYNDSMDFAKLLSSFAIAGDEIMKGDRSAKQRAVLKAGVELRILPEVAGKKLDVFSDNNKDENLKFAGLRSLGWLGTQSRYTFTAAPENLYSGKYNYTEEDYEKILNTNLQAPDANAGDGVKAMRDAVMSKEAEEKMLDTMAGRKKNDDTYDRDDYQTYIDLSDLPALKGEKGPIFDMGAECNRDLIKSLPVKDIDRLSAKFDEIFEPFVRIEQSFLDALNGQNGRKYAVSPSIEEVPENVRRTLINCGCFFVKEKEKTDKSAYQEFLEFVKAKSKKNRKDAIAANDDAEKYMKAYIMYKWVQTKGWSQISYYSFCFDGATDRIGLYKRNASSVNTMYTQDEWKKNRDYYTRRAKERLEDITESSMGEERKLIEYKKFASFDASQKKNRERWSFEEKDKIRIKKEAERQKLEEEKRKQEQEKRKIEEAKKAEKETGKEAEKNAAKKLSDKEQYTELGLAANLADPEKGMFDKAFFEKINTSDFFTMDNKEVLEQFKNAGFDYTDPGELIPLIMLYALGEMNRDLGWLYNSSAEERAELGKKLLQDIADHGKVGKASKGIQENKARENIEWYGRMLKKAVTTLKKEGIAVPNARQLGTVNEIKELKRTRLYAASNISHFVTDCKKKGLLLKSDSTKNETNPHGINQEYVSKTAYGYGYEDDLESLRAIETIGSTISDITDPGLSMEARVKMKLLAEYTFGGQRIFGVDKNNKPDTFNRNFVQGIKCSDMTGFSGVFSKEEMEKILSTPVSGLDKALRRKSALAVKGAINREKYKGDVSEVLGKGREELKYQSEFIRKIANPVIREEKLGQNYANIQPATENDQAMFLEEISAAFRAQAAKAKEEGYKELATFLNNLGDLSDLRKVNLLAVSKEYPAIGKVLSLYTDNPLLKQNPEKSIIEIYEDALKDKSNTEQLQLMMSDAEKLTEVIKALNGKLSKDPDKECLKACAAIKQGEIYSAQTQAAVAELTAELNYKNNGWDKSEKSIVKHFLLKFRG